MFLRELLIRILLYKDRLLEVIHDLQDKDQLFFFAQLCTLKVRSDDLLPLTLQLVHLVLSILVHAFSDQEKVGLHTVDFLLDCHLEFSEGVLGVGIRWGFFLETFEEGVDFFFYAFEEVI